MRKGEFYSAMFGIIKNEKWEILFQKRANTWFRDWKYQLPSWHLEWEEKMVESLIRELKEELWIEVEEKDCELVHITHRVEPKWRVYFNAYFNVNAYSWELKNLETHKCDELYWASKNEIDTNELFAYDREILDLIYEWSKFSETLNLFSEK